MKNLISSGILLMIKVNIKSIVHDLNRAWRIGAVHVTGSRFISIPVSIVQRILLARVLGVANIGHIAVVRSCLIIINLPATMGMFIPTTKLVAEESGKSAMQSVVLATAFWFIFCTSSIITVITLITLGTIPIITDNISKDLLSFIIIFMPFIALSQIMKSSLAGQEKMRIIAKVDTYLAVSGALFVVIICYLFSLKGWLVYKIAFIFIEFSLLFYLVGAKIPFKFDGKVLSRMLRIGLFGFMSQSVAQVLLQFDTLCISGIMKDAEATGIYNTAALASQQMMVVVSGILYTLFPYVAKNRCDLPKLYTLYKELSIKILLLSGTSSLLAWLGRAIFFSSFW